MAVFGTCERQAGSGLATLGAFEGQVGPGSVIWDRIDGPAGFGRAVSGAVEHQVGHGPEISGAFEHQVGPGPAVRDETALCNTRQAGYNGIFSFPALFFQPGDPYDNSIIIRILRIESNIHIFRTSVFLDRLFGIELTVQVGLERQFRAPSNVQLALDRRFWASLTTLGALDDRDHWKRRFRAPVGRASQVGPGLAVLADRSVSGTRRRSSKDETGFIGPCRSTCQVRCGWQARETWLASWLRTHWGTWTHKGTWREGPDP